MASETSPRIDLLRVELVHDVYRAANTVADLAGIHLCDDWTGREDEFRHALITCFENMEIMGDPEAASQAFVQAAHASRMAVFPDDVENMKQAAE